MSLNVITLFGIVNCLMDLPLKPPDVTDVTRSPSIVEGIETDASSHNDVQPVTVMLVPLLV
jgi:hypothetical protein